MSTQTAILLSVVALVAPTLAQTSTVHLATRANLSNSFTILETLGAGDPNALLIITPNWSPEKGTGVYVKAPLGVFYNAGKWAIFTQDQSALPESAAFNVEVFKPTANHFVHRATRGTISASAGALSTLSHPLLDGKPDAVFFVTANWNPGGQGGTYNPHPIALAYQAKLRKWAIANTDGAAMSENSSFNVVIEPGVRHAASKTNATQNYTRTELKKRSAFVLATPVFSGTLSPTGVFYSGGEWSVFTQDQSALPESVAFNLRSPELSSALLTAVTTISAEATLFTDWKFEAGGLGWKVETAYPYGPREVFAQRDWDASELPRPPSVMPLGGDYWQPLSASALLGRGGVGRGYFDSGVPRQGTRSVAWQGTVTSSEFVCGQAFMHFKVGGQPDAQVAVELQVRGAAGEAFTTVQSVRGSSADGLLQPVLWDLHSYQGRRGRIVIRDQSAVSFITADDFQFTENNKPLGVSVVAPVLWGFADTHTHPAAHLAFGGQTYWGDPTWNPAAGRTPETTLLDCTPGHGFGGTGLTGLGEGLDLVASLIGPGFAALGSGFINAGASLFGVHPAPMDTLGNVLASLPVISHDKISRLSLNAVEQSGGHGTNAGTTRAFREWPKHDSRTHQHMHEAWIKRSYDGGLRLMVAHVVETELIANLNPKPGFGPLNNRSAVERQLVWIKAMAARHSGWMEIAYTPADARRIVGQNKLALVLGVEVDHLGDFGRPGGPEATEANVRSYLNDLQRLGVRHLYSIHFADNPFGACSLYNPIFDLNHFVLTGSMHSVREGADVGVFYKSVMGMSDLFGAADRDVRRRQLRDVVRTKGLENIRLNGGLNVPMGSAMDTIFAFEDSHRADFTGNNRSHHGFVNANGLNPLGEFFLKEVIARGMILDADHLSDLALERTLTLCEAEAVGSPDGKGYPLIAGHTTFRALSLTPGDPLFDDHTNSHEGDKPERAVERIRALGGMVSPITAGKAVKSLPGSSVPNNCPDSSAAFAQQYLYGTQQMNGVGVGIASDMALNGAFGPRFGPGAGHSIAGHASPQWLLGYDHEREHYTPPIIPALATAWQPIWYGQNNPVAYRTPLTDWGGYRWEADGGYTQRERDTFCALAASFAGETPETFERKVADFWQMPVYGFLSAIGATLRDSPVTFGLGPALDGRRKWMLNVIKGLSRNAIAEISAPLLGDAFKGPDIELATLDVKQGRGPRRRDELPRRVGTPDFDYAFYFQSYQVLSKVYPQLKKVREAGRVPLERSMLGTRQFDINFDGIAHYGMLPDMLQDMKNNGMTARDFVPLFRSAEDYVQMWERCQNFTAAAKLRRVINNAAPGLGR